MIVGILAAIAVPQYLDYVKKTKISESIVLQSPYRYDAVEYYAGHGTFGATSGDFDSAYFNSITNGVVGNYT